ncbi:MAG: glycoside hydrolase family 3 N-terminal domain-containing protein [Prolixibacteraceae bacterium]|jgi:beta-glucosidase-like glycosyl hydrolase/CubicO group peptidase (beta-lactamase class C family)|nr:glycoside hydrolase family 3 N-terminal domain-containing protein [Prolixibacteraceae bacterium]
MKKRCLLLIIYLGISIAAKPLAQPGFLKLMNDPWVNSTLAGMSLDEKIGQLFMVQAYSEKAAEHTSSVLSDIQKYKVGGVIFMEGDPEAQAAMTNRFQKESKIPVLIAMDAEWGLGFRLGSSLKYPVQMALGAVQDDSLIYRMGKEIGQQCRRLGVHINFAPVADINSNPENPVIGYRSFGSDKTKVAQKAWMYASGLQDAGALACAKHFPGHGDTDSDSHITLPVITQNENFLDSVAMFPFRFLSEKGIASVMTAHLQLPALEPDQRIPSSLSEKIIQEKLLVEAGFQGLVITDGMNMQGVSKQFAAGEAAVMAIRAGNDILEIVPNLGQAVVAVKKAIAEGILSEEMIVQKCRKILAAKKWLGLDDYKPVELQNLVQDLNKGEYLVTRRKLFQESLTVLINNSSVLPLQRLDTLRIATLSIGSGKETSFQRMLENYTTMDHFVIPENATAAETAKILKQLKPYNLLIAGVHGMKLTPSGNFGLTGTQLEAIRNLDHQKSIVCLFGNPYALNRLPKLEKARALLVTYQENITTQELAAQVVFGALGANGKLPVNVNSRFRLNDGFTVKKNGRLSYSFPENVGIRSDMLYHKVDSLACLGLKEKAYPGCQILIAKNGEVIFHECYGYYTYDTIVPVKRESIYDWASITKITSSLPALMKLYSEKKIELDVPFSDYWPDFKGSNKEQMTLREMLAHQAGMIPFIPFYKGTQKSSENFRQTAFRERPTNKFSIRISSNLYENKNCVKDIYQEIRDSELLPRKEYIYSDLGFIIYRKAIERLTGNEFEQYLKTNFYKPLGAGSITYNPYKYYPIGDIVPTEDDRYFRNELIQGFVHDEAAAMQGGVSGHAGLFGTANDLAKLMQMYMQYGWYGGHRYIDSLTIKEFIRRQYPDNKNRRALGFDKPLIDNHRNSLKDAFPANDASENSFGHSGFTGTFAWADPDNHLLFIYFTNRVYPSRNNSKMFDMNLRTQIHQAIYDCIRGGLGNH